MNRDGLGVPESKATVTEGGVESLTDRLERVERAYEELVERVQRYERERAQIRRRLERLLDRLGGCGLTDG